MNILEQIRLVEQLDQLIRMKATGTPKDIAARLEMSERNFYRLIDGMKTMGFPISYCKLRQTYFYEKTVKFSFEIYAIDEQEKGKIKGGKNLIELFFKLTDFGSEGVFLCDR